MEGDGMQYRVFSWVVKSPNNLAEDLKKEDLTLDEGWVAVSHAVTLLTLERPQQWTGDVLVTVLAQRG